MQRVATQKTRGPNAAEKRFQRWVKQQSCAFCYQPPFSIVDHAEGSTFRHNKVLVGHWFVLPKCRTCDEYKTNGSHNLHYANTKKTHAEAWMELIQHYPRRHEVPTEVILSIKNWNR